jgi:SAM-dependent methyltransferase
VAQNVTVEPEITTLPRTVAAPEGKPVRPEAADNQRLMAEIARDPSTWNADLAAFTTQVFDAMAENWAEERGGYRAAPLLDALERGGPFPVGRCLQIGSGTGVLTPSLETAWSEVVCLDLSRQMLRHERSRSRVQADASKLPFSDGTFDVIVIGDAPLFAGELVRCLSAAGTLIWSNALGQGAPYYVPTGSISDTLVAADPGSVWSGVESEALWGSWVVFHRRAPGVTGD